MEYTRLWCKRAFTQIYERMGIRMDEDKGKMVDTDKKGSNSNSNCMERFPTGGGESTILNHMGALY